MLVRAREEKDPVPSEPVKACQSVCGDVGVCVSHVGRIIHIVYWSCNVELHGLIIIIILPSQRDRVNPARPEREQR